MYLTYYLHLVGIKEVIGSLKITSDFHIAVMCAALGV
jgi:hypothetical protein